MKRPVLGCLVALTSAPAIAQSSVPETGPWTKYQQSAVKPDYPWSDENPEHQWESEHGYYWIFERDVKREGRLVSAWIREKYKTPQPNGTVLLTTRITLDCDGRYRYSAQSSYRSDGSVVQEIDRVDDWVFIRPGTKFEVFQQSLCRRGN
ncbi:hypothetical protein N0B51_00030 [Tsuneonella sp. YG55]|uniref:Surface-adhesin protein E-like domain-containing protein n=1 Tax=Tsuneonella litorea TaxID=2976475 RepID=A0A9X2VXX1_9SPHN|nr:surface-adhesin E family protein [Tsuneonella litorea]MCT2557363.1 hypothetical protein [Tsuneonella litorea]